MYNTETASQCLWVAGEGGWGLLDNVERGGVGKAYLPLISAPIYFHPIPSPFSGNTKGTFKRRQNFKWWNHRYHLSSISSLKYGRGFAILVSLSQLRRVMTPIPITVPTGPERDDVAL